MNKKTVNSFRKRVTNSAWWKHQINMYLNGPIQRAFSNTRGVTIMQKEWDNLFLIDAARADLFEQTVDISKFDEYERVRSQGSSTREWLKQNFNKDYGDTIYVSGTPVPSRYASSNFFRFVEVWREGFDPEIGTIRAETVSEAALEVHKENPNKRLIVHFIQPHYPFVRNQEYQYSYWHGTDELSHGSDSEEKDVWHALDNNKVTNDEIWEAYSNNLEYVMEQVFNLLENINGKSVIHSDHGNLMGERSWPIPIQSYGHPHGIRIEELITVPWATVNKPRRRIVEGNAQETGENNDLDDKLRALGYTE